MSELGESLGGPGGEGPVAGVGGVSRVSRRRPGRG